MYFTTQYVHTIRVYIFSRIQDSLPFHEAVRFLQKGFRLLTTDTRLVTPRLAP